MATKDEILGKDDLTIERVNVPEWGCEVCVRTMSAAERDAFEASYLGQDDIARMANVRARFCCLIICDDEGGRVFDDEDADALGKKSASALDRIFEVGQRLNGLSANDVEELEKNSETGPGEGSSSG